MPRRRKDGRDRSGKTVKPIQRNAANARERSRMRVLSKAFSKLKTTLPWVPADTKLSKLDTLRLASSYIAHLAEMLDAGTEDVIKSSRVHPLNLTWPFSFSDRFTDANMPQKENDADYSDDNDNTLENTLMQQYGGEDKMYRGHISPDDLLF